MKNPGCPWQLRDTDRSGKEMPGLTGTVSLKSSARLFWLPPEASIGEHASGDPSLSRRRERKEPRDLCLVSVVRQHEQSQLLEDGAIPECKGGVTPCCIARQERSQIR